MVDDGYKKLKKNLNHVRVFGVDKNFGEKISTISGILSRTAMTIAGVIMVTLVSVLRIENWISAIKFVLGRPIDIPSEVKEAVRDLISPIGTSSLFYSLKNISKNMKESGLAENNKINEKMSSLEGHLKDILSTEKLSKNFRDKLADKKPKPIEEIKEKPPTKTGWFLGRFK